MSWVVFSYALPSGGRSSPRVAVWRRLRALGAISPKGGVHVLPARDECVEGLQWLAQEVEQAKGEALLMRVERFEGLTDARLVELFQAARREAYAAVDAPAAELESALAGARRHTSRDHPQARDLLARLKREHGEIARIDFFNCPEGAQVAARLARIEQALAAGPPMTEVPHAAITAYRTKRWVTRPNPHVDRLACAWLIRRFINPRAQIRYADTPQPDEVAFDTSRGPFSHRGNLCTFETMTKAFGLDDPALHVVAEIVHDIDLRDGRYARPEIGGIDIVLRGWLLAGLSDSELESQGIALFDGLYTAFSRRPRLAGR